MHRPTAISLRNRAATSSLPPSSSKTIISASPVAGSTLLAVSFCSGAIFIWFLSLRPSLHDLDDVPLLFLQILFLLHTLLYLYVHTGHRCVAPPPEPPSRAVFLHCLGWVLAQVVAFSLVHTSWRASWSETKKNVAVVWMLLSFSTLGLWSFVLISVLGPQVRYRRNPDDVERARGCVRLRKRTTRVRSAPRDVPKDEKAAAAAAAEQIEFKEPPPAYIAPKVGRVQNTIRTESDGPRWTCGSAAAPSKKDAH
ncbi:hypothetical protein C8035_v001903 [Colletotrichum spinosum]|uniref:Uncharacterized protein n=1 Tax=Colletotrichum spinosum TaxID=1347390 RepID=A0A4R8PYJ1_9PEZI|nr:hypothetical protein C8035_v001903 [Colletotrichum spinosum]